MTNKSLASHPKISNLDWGRFVCQFCSSSQLEHRVGKQRSDGFKGKPGRDGIQGAIDKVDENRGMRFYCNKCHTRQKQVYDKKKGVTTNPLK